ncbi:MAG: hypothetical protein EPN33_07010 [Acidobacteria bacterium]|nr:MAG: hypothetical protein EPN33_07010 [Acidobacteriota bacterium]
MAFVRKKGKSYYLVHNVREDGHVRQVHLACLGNRPRVSDEVLDQVRASHPQLQIDWAAVRARAAETFVSPFADLEGVDLLLRSIRTLVQDLAELDFGLLQRHLQERGQVAEGEPRVRELLREMAELRTQLDLKLKHQPGAAAAPSVGEHQGLGD